MPDSRGPTHHDTIMPEGPEPGRGQLREGDVHLDRHLVVAGPLVRPRRHVLRLLLHQEEEGGRKQSKKR